MSYHVIGEAIDFPFFWVYVHWKVARIYTRSVDRDPDPSETISIYYDTWITWCRGFFAEVLSMFSEPQKEEESGHGH